jgi:hypothetical protein
MATTTNYGWTTPNDTDLVKDGAAAIRTLGSSIDTTTKALNPSTTLGDIEYRSSTANTNTRLPLGTASQVLSVNSGATAPEWVTLPAAGGMTLISTTALSGATVNLTSIPTTYKHLMMTIVGEQHNVNTNQVLELILNADTGTNYFYNAIDNIETAISGDRTTVGTSFYLGRSAPSGNSGKLLHSSITWLPNYTVTSGNQQYSMDYVSSRTSSASAAGVAQGNYAKSAAITSIRLQASQDFQAGTVYLYGVS